MNPEPITLLAAVRANPRILIPNAITLGGVLVSYLSILYTFDGHYASAAWFIWYASLLDIVDGGVARLLRASSTLGKELDSLVDLIRVGIAPSLLIYQLYFRAWGFWGLMIAFVYLSAVAIRLAGFNLRTDHNDHYFSGLSSPIAANVLGTFVIFSQDVWGAYPHPEWVALMVIGVSTLMLGGLPFAGSNFIMLKRLFHTWQGWVVVVGFFLGLLIPGQMLFYFYSGYVLFYLGRALVVRTAPLSA